MFALAKNKKLVILLMFGVFLAGYFLVKTNTNNAKKMLKVGNETILVEVKNDNEGRARGLSYRQSLGTNEGMLFIFPQKQQLSFWMKGMEFDLDMIWIAEGRVVEITSGVLSPKNNNGQIVTVSPNVLSDWVLEVNRNFAQEKGIKVGDKVEFAY